jgi:hypothetical protein
MNWLNKLYRYIFERDCLDFSQPYIDNTPKVTLEDANIETKQYDNRVSLPPRRIATYGSASIFQQDTSGYHNSKLYSRL